MAGTAQTYDISIANPTVPKDTAIFAGKEKTVGEYLYNYKQFMELKDSMNKTKQQLDQYYANNKTKKHYETVVVASYLYDDLRGASGKIESQYGGEAVSNAWLKMREFISQYVAEYISTSVTKKPSNLRIDKVMTMKRKETTLNTFHVAEAPGTFIPSLHHYIKNNHPEIDWEWYAQSYVAQRNKNKHIQYLADRYGLIRNFKAKWLEGADSDGDITSAANIRSYGNSIQSIFGKHLHIFTGDIKIPIGTNYDEEEAINIVGNLGQSLTCLMTLGKGGICFMKTFAAFEAPTISIFYLIALCFEKTFLFKPETSRSVNSEVYIVGVGHRSNLSKAHFNKLLKALTYIKEVNGDYTHFDSKKIPSLLKQSDIPADFIEKVYAASKELVDKQTVAINRVIGIYHTYKKSSTKKLNEDMHVIKEKTAEEWIARHNIRELADDNKLIIGD
jgi:hypothetical protein